MRPAVWSYDRCVCFSRTGAGLTGSTAILRTPLRDGRDGIIEQNREHNCNHGERADKYHSAVTMGQHWLLLDLD